MTNGVMTPGEVVIDLMQHCSVEELRSVIHAANWMIEAAQGKLTHHDTREADPVPTAVDWRPGVLPGDFGPESTHTPTGGQLPPSSMDETINKGRFK